MISKKTIDIGGEQYTLELDRDVIIQAEERYGFALIYFDTQIMSQSYKLWSALLHKNHSNLSVEKRKDLFDTYNQETGEAFEVVREFVEFIGNSFLAPTQQKKKKKA